MSTQSKSFLTPYTSNFRHKQFQNNQELDHSLDLLYSNTNNNFPNSSNSNPLDASFLIPQYPKESTPNLKPQCVSSTDLSPVNHSPDSSGLGLVRNEDCEDLSDFCNLFEAPPSLSVSPDSVFSKSESSCSSSNLDYSYDFGDVKSAGDAIFSGPLEDPQDWSPLFESSSQADTPAHAPVSPPLMIRTFHSTERRSAIVVNNKNKVSKPTAANKSPVAAQPPIVVSDPSDSSAIRRARNTEAARRSRAKKNEKIEELEALVAELMAQNDSLQAELRVYRRLSE